MKKIITASIVAIMAVTAANADIASTTYVTSRTGTVSFDSGAAKGKTNLTEAIKAVDAALGTTTGNAATKSELEGAQQALQGNIDKKVDNTTYIADKTAQAAVDQKQTEDIAKNADAISKLDTTYATDQQLTDGLALKVDKTAQTAVDQKQTEDIAKNADAISKLDSTYATDAQATDAAKAATDALNLTEVGATGSFISTVSQTKGTVAAQKTAFVDTINDTTKDSTIAPQTKAVKTYVDTQFGVVNQANSSVAQKVGALESAVTAKGALIDQFADYKTSNDDRVDALEDFNTGLGTAATVNATTNNVVTSVTTTNGKVTAVGSAQITNAMVAANAGIEKSKLASGVQTSLDKADAALPASSLEQAAKKAAGAGDGEYALTMKVVNNVINYQWDKVTY